MAGKYKILGSYTVLACVICRMILLEGKAALDREAEEVWKDHVSRVHGGRNVERIRTTVEITELTPPWLRESWDKYDALMPRESRR